MKFFFSEEEEVERKWMSKEVGVIEFSRGDQAKCLQVMWSKHLTFMERILEGGRRERERGIGLKGSESNFGPIYSQIGLLFPHPIQIEKYFQIHWRKTILKDDDSIVSGCFTSLFQHNDWLQPDVTRMRLGKEMAFITPVILCCSSLSSIEVLCVFRTRSGCSSRIRFDGGKVNQSK